MSKQEEVMKRSLMDCRNIDQVAKLKRDNFQRGDFSIQCDGHFVWLGEQKVFENPTQAFQIPKPVFDALIRRYMKPQGETK